MYKLSLFEFSVIGLPFCLFVEDSDAGNTRFDTACVEPTTIEAHLEHAVDQNLDLSPTKGDQEWILRGFEFVNENLGDARLQVSDLNDMYRLEDYALGTPPHIAFSAHMSYFQLCDKSGVPTGLMDLVRLTGPWWLAATRTENRGRFNITMELLHSSLQPTMLLRLTRPELIGAALARWLTESV